MIRQRANRSRIGLGPAIIMDSGCRRERFRYVPTARRRDTTTANRCLSGFVNARGAKVRKVPTDGRCNDPSPHAAHHVDCLAGRGFNCPGVRGAESDENTKGPFVVMSLSALRLNLAEAYEAPRDSATPVYVELALANILADIEIS